MPKYYTVLCTVHQTLESEEREREREWERRRVAEARAGLVLEAQLGRQRKDELKKLAQENRQLAEEQLARWAVFKIGVFPEAFV